MTAIGALIGLSLSILLIIRKLSPTYSLIIGAIVGGLLGGLSLNETVTVMTEGVKEVTPAVLRILTAGVLSGILIQTGATTVISNAIINKMGEKRVFMALALATMLLLQSPNQKIPDRKTKCVIKTHINIKQNVIFGAKLKPV